MKPKIQNYLHKQILKDWSKVILFGMMSMLFVLQSCDSKKKAPEVTKTKEISDLSIYNLPSKWTNQDGKEIEMKDMKGKVLVMVMIYTSCKAACPRLVADMRNIESRLPEDIKKNVQLVLVSIDPKVDTPERLKAFSIEN